MQARTVNLLPTRQTVGYQVSLNPLLLTRRVLGNCGISDVVRPLSRGRQQRVQFMGKVPDVYEDRYAEVSRLSRRVSGPVASRSLARLGCKTGLSTPPLVHRAAPAPVARSAAQPGTCATLDTDTPRS